MEGRCNFFRVAKGTVPKSFRSGLFFQYILSNEVIVFRSWLIQTACERMNSSNIKHKMPVLEYESTLCFVRDPFQGQHPSQLFCIRHAVGGDITSWRNLAGYSEGYKRALSFGLVHTSRRMVNKCCSHIHCVVSLHKAKASFPLHYWPAVGDRQALPSTHTQQIWINTRSHRVNMFWQPTVLNQVELTRPCRSVFP